MATSQQTRKPESDRIIASAQPKKGITTRIVAVLNILCMLCSFPFLGMGIWLATGHGTECLRSILQWPIIAIGLLIFVFSIVGFIGSCFRVRIVLLVYLAVTLLIIVLLLAFTAFAFIVASPGSGESVSGRQYKEYHLDRYSKWLQHEVSTHRNWEKIKTCIQGANVCQKLSIYTDSDSFFNADLSPLQSGCCKPPTACNFTFVNATYWIPTTTAPNSDQAEADADCSIWNNDQADLCYECDSCRAGVAQTIRNDWVKKVSLMCAGVFVFMIVMFILSYSAARNSKKLYYVI